MSIKPLKQSVQLHGTPSQKAKYGVTVKSCSGDNVILGDPKITRALVALMDLSAVNGGAASHWGGPAGIAECMSAVHGIMFQGASWADNFNFINDIGHAENGIYALRANLGFGDLDFGALKGFRSIESKLTGHGESHLYPEGVLLSNGPLSSSLPQAQGLAFADKLLGNERTTIVAMSDGASMEGEAKESFSAIPGFFKAGKMNPFIMIISDNDTKLSGRISEDSFDMNPTLNSLKTLGWEEIKIENGNDLEACYQGMEKAIELSKENKPVFVWLKTTKGFGVAATAESKSGGHGFPLKAYSTEIHSFLEEILGGDIPSDLKLWADELSKKPEVKNEGSSAKKEKAQAGLARGMIKAAKEGKAVYSVSCDLAGSTGVAAFQKEFPERFVDVGIAEANMVSHAAGMSRAGFIPIVDTFAAFGVTKGNLPLIMASLSSCPLIAVFSHTGFQDAADGASHQSLTYLSAVSSIPNTKVIIVSTSAEAEALMYEAICDIETKRNNKEPADSYIFFVGRESYPIELENDGDYKLNKSRLLKSGDSGLIVTAGATLFKALEVSKKHNVSIIVSPNINNPDVELVASELAKNNGKLITVEDHQTIGGMGAQLVHALKLKGVNDFSVSSLAVDGVFGRSAYTADQLYVTNGLGESAIESAVLS